MAKPKAGSEVRRRTTRASEAIREVFMASKRPISAQEVFEKGREHCASLGIATVYRWIRRLLDEGVLREVHLPDVGTRYEYITPEHHHYFHCRRCGQLFVLTRCAGALEAMVPDGFVMESHEIILRGYCAECSRTETFLRKAALLQKTDSPERQ